MGTTCQIIRLVYKDIRRNINRNRYIVMGRMWPFSINDCPCSVLGFIFRRARSTQLCFDMFCAMFGLLIYFVFRCCRTTTFRASARIVFSFSSKECFASFFCFIFRINGMMALSITRAVFMRNVNFVGRMN